jgi:murein DD-endopeptidase MepM/ murein hydrolase activator NlpD
VDDTALFADGSAFVFPAEGGWRSAGFGDARRYLYSNGSSDRSVHAGIDWAVVAGTAVRACARGRVVMSADRAVTGKSIILEHLPGLYSLYFHLSALEVKEGDIVERGARIALSGSTGMSTGPHLHWELRAMGEAVDPEYWLKVPLLDKTAVAAIMNGLIEGR